MLVSALIGSTIEKSTLALRGKTWFSVVWICSWLAVKPPLRPCSGGSYTSSQTLTSKVGLEKTQLSQLQTDRRIRNKVCFEDKVQAEMDRVVGHSRQPTTADRTNMPYTDAVIHEIQRMGNIVPLNGLRMAAKDTTLGGYIIPKVHLIF